MSDRSRKWIFGLMLGFAILAFLASFTLSVEKLELLKNPDAKLSCSINAALNCASVMKTPQASVFGFPNSYLGIMGFAIVISVAIGGLLRVKYSKPYLIVAQIGYGLGLVFAYWLFFQSVYVIQILCPWCLVVTIGTTVVFETLLRYNLRLNNFGLKRAMNQKVQRFLDQDIDKFITIGWLVFLTLLVIMKFGDSLIS